MSVLVGLGRDVRFGKGVEGIRKKAKSSPSILNDQWISFSTVSLPHIRNVQEKSC
jgi:hypothetical protein